MHYETGFSKPEEYGFDERRMRQADARKTAGLATDEAERHASAIHVQAVLRAYELNPGGRSI